MKAAVVGCGGMGRVHARSYAGMKDVELVAVCDLIIEKADEVALATGATAFQSLDDLLASVQIDVISITVPSYLHKDLVVKAAAAGVHVICEKPSALTLADTEEMMAACETNQVSLFIGHVVRFFPEYVQMKEAIDRGELGQVGIAHAKRAGSHPGDIIPWFKEDEKSGGVIVDLMIHDIDFMRWAIGEVKSVYALRRCDDQMDYALVTLIFENGAAANLESYWGYPGSFHTSAEIAGDRGIVRANSQKTATLQIVKRAVDTEGGRFVEVPGSPGFRNPYEIELGHFIDCIRAGHSPRVTATDAYKALEIALAAMESVRTGKAVELGSGRESK
ncbi:gfo/Idh/MocA family oxidoreductase [Paenibacillaceae bacterium]|nr:gfo/Idh/MocA family oxidoreductase [Paenibacillaceae bacterium]